jgi:pyruvate/2-oxoglutarate/acetoin dehydrogenase E1 component
MNGDYCKHKGVCFSIITRFAQTHKVIEAVHQIEIQQLQGIHNEADARQNINYIDKIGIEIVFQKTSAVIGEAEVYKKTSVSDGIIRIIQQKIDTRHTNKYAQQKKKLRSDKFFGIEVDSCEENPTTYQKLFTHRQPV